MKMASKITDNRYNSRRWHEGLKWAERKCQAGNRAEVERYIRQSPPECYYFMKGASDYLEHVNKHPDIIKIDHPTAINSGVPYYG